MAYISPGGHRAPAPRRAAGRCTCEAMVRLTGARPAAARRWGYAATAFLLLLLTVQAGKGGHGGGKAWRGPGVPAPLSSPCAGVGLDMVQVPGDGCGRLGTALRQPWCHGEGWMWLLDVPRGAWGQGLGSPLPRAGSVLWAEVRGCDRLPDPRSAGLKPALGWEICGIAGRQEADLRDGAEFPKGKMLRGGRWETCQACGRERSGRKAPRARRSSKPAAVHSLPAPLPAAGGSQHQRGGSDRARSGHSTASARPAAPPHSSAGTVGTPSLPGPRGAPQSHQPSCAPRASPPGMLGVWGSAQGRLCSRRGQDGGRQPGLGASPAWHGAISQHGPAWDTVVPALLLRKGSLLAPEDTTVPTSPRPPHTSPWHQPAFWHGEERREDVHKARLPQSPR